MKNALPCFEHLFSSSTRFPPPNSPTMGRSFDDADPLTLAIAPPPDETPEQRQAREIAEAEARRISDEIDEQIRREKEGDKKKKKPVKLLLLGQPVVVPPVRIFDIFSSLLQDRARVERQPHSKVIRVFV